MITAQAILNVGMVIALVLGFEVIGICQCNRISVE